MGSVYTGTTALSKAIGQKASAPTFIEAFDVEWDDKYDPDAPLELPALKGHFLAAIPAFTSSGHVALIDGSATPAVVRVYAINASTHVQEECAKDVDLSDVTAQVSYIGY